MSAIKKPPIARVMLIQLVSLLVLTALGLLISGKVGAASVLLGALISVIPNAYFAHKVFRYSGARSTEKLVRSAYVGEIIKLVLTGTGFALVFSSVRTLDTAAFFAGFILVYLAGLVGAAYVFRH